LVSSIKYVTVTITLLTWLISETVYSEEPVNSSLEDLSIELSARAQNAVNNGVSLTFDCDFANLQTLFFLNIPRNKTQHRFTLTRHTLSNRYIVKRDNLDTPHMFRTIPEASNYIVMQAIGLLEFYNETDTNRKMRLSLNKYMLPSPMRLPAFIFNEWDLDTGWVRWEFES